MRSSVACWRSGALALCLALGAAPGTGAEPPGDDPTLESLMRELATPRGVEVEFRERKEIALLAAPLENRGRLYFVPPDRLARFTTSPAFESLIIDGDRMRLRQGHDGEELDLAGSPAARAVFENLIVLFNGDLDRLRELYEIEYRAREGRWVLGLSPRRAPLEHFIASITMRGGRRGIQEMEILETRGSRTLTTFETVSERLELSAAELDRLFSSGELPPDATGRP